MNILFTLLGSFLLCLIDIVRATPWERQVIASAACASQRITTGICSPGLGETWYNGNYYQVIWNYNHPAYHSEENTINVYLLNRSSNGTFTPIKKWDGVPVAPGTLVVQVDDSWFLEPLPAYAHNRTRIAYLYLMKEGRSIQAEIESNLEFPAPIQFRLIQSPSIATDDPMTVSPTSRAPAPGRAREAPNPTFHGWTIALLTVACFLFAALVICVVYWLTRGWQRRREKQLQRRLHDEETKLPLDDGKVQTALTSSPTPPVGSSITIHRTSAVQLLGASGDSSSSSSSGRQQQQQQRFSSSSTPYQSMITTTPDDASQKTTTAAAAAAAAATASSSSPQLPSAAASDHRQSSTVLSSTDAIMIADTFRQFMRKPEWQQQSNGDPPAQVEDNVTDDDTSITKQTPWDETEEQRKRLGDRLLHKELAEEGTSVHRVERRSTRSTQRSVPSPSPSTSTQQRQSQPLHEPQEPPQPQEQQQVQEQVQVHNE